MAKQFQIPGGPFVNVAEDALEYQLQGYGFLNQEQAAGGGITASLSQTLGALTSSAAARLGIEADLSASLGALTVTGTASLRIEGDLAQTLGALTGALTARLAIDADLAQTLGALTLSASATMEGAPRTASLDQTLGALTLVATASGLAVPATPQESTGHGSANILDWPRHLRPRTKRQKSFIGQPDKVPEKKRALPKRRARLVVELGAMRVLAAARITDSVKSRRRRATLHMLLH